MTISNVQAEKYATAASNAVTVAWDSTPTSGNLLIARAIGAGASDGGAISGWTSLTTAPRYGASTGYVNIFWKIAGGSEGDVTVTFTGSNPTRIEISEWSNSDGWASTPIDVQSYADSTGGVTSKSTGTTGTTAIAIELAVAVTGWGGAVTGISWTNSFTSSYEVPVGSITFSGAYKILSATGTVETTASWTTSRYCGAAVATFKGNAPAGGWTNIAKVNGLASSGIAKVKGVAVASIAKVNGVAV